MLRLLGICAVLLMLAACGNARDPGYVCMGDCAHYCEDGIRGDSCRRDLQLEKADYDSQNRSDHDYYYGRDYDDRTSYDRNDYAHDHSGTYYEHGYYGHDNRD